MTKIAFKIPQKVREVIIKKAESRSPMTQFESALLIIIEIENALASGTKHFNVAGKELTTVDKVLDTLNKEGKVQLVTTNSIN